MIAPRPTSRPRGMILLEVLFAIALFGMGALALSRALAMSAQASVESQMDLRMIEKLQSALTYYSKLNRVEPTRTPIQTDPDLNGVWTETQIIEMTERDYPNLKTEQGQVLAQMFHIMVTAKWERDGQRGEITAETYRYAPLYRQQTGQ
jgi:Tfp pilus assembly protein PilV